MTQGTRKISGAITLLGNSISIGNEKCYSLIEVRDNNGRTTTIYNVAISIFLDNYLNVSDTVDLYIAPALRKDFINFYKTPSNKATAPQYVYGIKADGRDVVGHIPFGSFGAAIILLSIGIILMFGVVTIPVSLYIFHTVWKTFILVNKMKADVGQ